MPFKEAFAKRILSFDVKCEICKGLAKSAFHSMFEYCLAKVIWSASMFSSLFRPIATIWLRN